jgi:hypothetical protein
MKITTIELACVGNAANGYVNAQCMVEAFEIFASESERTIDVCLRGIKMKDYERKDRVNYCRFEVPEGEICRYVRRIQIKPYLQERKWFRIVEGQLVELADDPKEICPGWSFARMLAKDYVSQGYSFRFTIGGGYFGGISNPSGTLKCS